MKKYEYKQFDNRENKSDVGIDYLNELGAKGWLLVHVSKFSGGEFWVMCREKE